MMSRQGNTTQSLAATESFLDEYASSFPDIANSDVRKRLRSAVAELRGHATDQDRTTTSVQSGTKQRKTLRNELIREHMAPISRIARANLPRTEEFSALKTPRGNPNTPQLTAAARAMTQTVAANVDVFVANGLPGDFVERLQKATDGLEKSVSWRKRSQDKTAGSRAGVRAAITSARTSVHIIDALMRVALKDQPVLLADWKSAKRVQRRSSSTKVVAETVAAAA